MSRPTLGANGRRPPWWSACAAGLFLAACWASPSSPPMGPEAALPPPAGATIDIGAAQPGQDGPWTFVAYRSPLPPAEALASYLATLESAGYRRGQDEGAWHAFVRGGVILMVAVSADGPPTSILVRVARIGDLPGWGSIVSGLGSPSPVASPGLLGTPGPPSRGLPPWPPGHGGTPPGQASAPPGHGGTPPGQASAPPGHGGTPPGQASAPPGHGGTPPGQASAPPANTPVQRGVQSGGGGNGPPTPPIGGRGRR